MRICKQLIIVTIGVLLLFSCSKQGNAVINSQEKNTKTEGEWKAKLSPEEYYVLREKGTEAPYSGKFTLHFEKGVYTCKGCGAVLFNSNSKFDSHCGWPSFDKEIGEGKIIQRLDTSHGMKRIEILCANCGGHLGHLFNDGPTKTGARYCVNSVSLNFIKQK